MKRLTVFVFTILFVLPVCAKQDNNQKAGGVRADHASEMGLDKGKAWAGSKEKKVKEEAEAEDRGHKAGGVRDEQASEKGVEKGKAWAGDNEKKLKEETDQMKGTENKEKKEKKEKKSK